MTVLSREDVQWQRAQARAVHVNGGRTVTLRAGLAALGDLGCGLVRVHPDMAGHLGAAEGDTVALSGAHGESSQSLAFARLALDAGQSKEMAAIDGYGN